MKEFNIVKDIVTRISKDKDLVLYNKENACVGTSYALYFLTKEANILDFENVRKARFFDINKMFNNLGNYKEITVTEYKKLDKSLVAVFSNNAWVDTNLYEKYLDKYDTMTYKGLDSKSPILVYNKKEELKMLLLPVAHKEN